MVARFTRSVPWGDLRYIFGDIMYGGHITDPYDRILCSAYLDQYICDELLLAGQSLLLPGLATPQWTTPWEELVDLMLANAPKECPAHLGIHQNVELDPPPTQ
ncbi:dynein heavy chain domain-containing protein, partial [Baffinella frigidus]